MSPREPDPGDLPLHRRRIRRRRRERATHAALRRQRERAYARRRAALRAQDNAMASLPVRAVAARPYRGERLGGVAVVLAVALALGLPAPALAADPGFLD